MKQNEDVLLDNWTLTDSFAFLYEPQIRPTEGDVLRSLICLCHLVESIVMFERIRFIPGHFQNFWGSLIATDFKKDFNKVFIPLDSEHTDLSKYTTMSPNELRDSELYKAGHQNYKNSKLLNTLAGTSFLKGEILKGCSPFDLKGAISYDLLSRHIEIPYVPHCLRSPVFMLMGQPEKSVALNMVNYALEVVENTSSDYRNDLNEFTGYYSFFVPIILSAILKQVLSPSDIIRVALQMRNSKEAVQFRKALSEASLEWQQGNNKKAALLKKDIDLLSTKLISKLESNNSTNITVSILGIGVPIPANLITIKDWFIVKRKPHLRFLQSLYNETIGIATISDLIEKVFDIKCIAFDEALWTQYKMSKVKGDSMHSRKKT